MPLNKVNLPPSLLQPVDPIQLKVGQRLLVEVVSQDHKQEGLISVGGKLIRAKLEAQVQTGERFWAVVKEADEQGIILSRVSLNKAKINNLRNEELLFLIKRGLALDPEIYDYLKRFIDPSNITFTTELLAILRGKNNYLQKLATVIWNSIPRWSQLSGSNFSPLLIYYQMLGIDYEYLIYEDYRNEQDNQGARSWPLKYYLLQILSKHFESLNTAEKACLNEILSEITGQQLWLQTGTGDSAYCLLHFPLFDKGELYQARLAIESSRYGRRIDTKHCHLALQVETPHIGLVGADLVLYDNKLSICILHDHIEEIFPLIQKMEAEIQKGFATLGFSLQQISGKTFVECPQFAKFISGIQLSGVDIKG